MAEVERTPEAEADLVGDADEQEVGEEQHPAALEVMQVEEKQQQVEMEEQQARVEHAGAPVQVAQQQAGHTRIHQVGEHERAEGGVRQPDAALGVLHRRHQAQDDETGGADERYLHRMHAVLGMGAALGQLGGVEREAGVHGAGALGLR